MKIGILTWHYGENFGSSLQAYALKTYLEKMGNIVEIINYRKYIGNYNKRDFVLRKIIKNILINFGIINNERSISFYFFEKRILHNKKAISSDQINYRNNFDIIIFGGDQIWNPDVLDTTYLGNFKNNNVFKISYSASFGKKIISLENSSLYYKYLKDFDFLSCREQNGVDFLNNEGLNAELVLDPVFLLDKDEYLKIKKRVKTSSKYSLTYFLKDFSKYEFDILSLIKKEDSIFVGINKEDGIDWINNDNNIGPQEFIYLINKCQKVITDSYHGCLFAIIFEKPFFLIERFETNKNNENQRLYNLRTNLGIKISNKERMIINSYNDIQEYKKKIDTMKEKSKKFLLNAIHFLDRR